jgi:hypothetical protein
MIYVDFNHGRNSSDEDPDGWGFDGPILGPFPYCHITYGCHIKLGDGSIPEELALRVDGLVELFSSYYGDFTVTDERTVLESPNLLKRCVETKRILNLNGKELPLLLGHNEQWVKNYFTFKCLPDKPKRKK